MRSSRTWWVRSTAAAITLRANANSFGLVGRFPNGIYVTRILAVCAID